MRRILTWPWLWTLSLLAFFLTALVPTQGSAQVYPDEVEVFKDYPAIITGHTCCFAPTGKYLTLTDFVVVNWGSTASRVQITVSLGGTAVGGTVLVGTVPATEPLQIHLNTGLVLTPGQGLTFFSDGLSFTSVFVSGYFVPVP